MIYQSYCISPRLADLEHVEKSLAFCIAEQDFAQKIWVKIKLCLSWTSLKTSFFNRYSTLNKQLKIKANRLPVLI
jgi:hypothetical protein